MSGPCTHGTCDGQRGGCFTPWCSCGCHDHSKATSPAANDTPTGNFSYQAHGGTVSQDADARYGEGFVAGLSSPDGRRVISYPTRTRVVPCGDYGDTVYTLCPEHA